MNNLDGFEEWLAEVTVDHFNNWQLKNRNYYMQTNITM